MSKVNADLFADIADLVTEFVEGTDIRQKIFANMIEVFEQRDCSVYDLYEEERVSDGALFTALANHYNIKFECDEDEDEDLKWAYDEDPDDGK